MVKDCLEYARRCEACQMHANFIHQPSEPLHPTIASWPFDAWGLDVVGPITPKSSAVHMYGVPRCIVTDNGKSFYNKLMDKLCAQFGFKQHNSLMYNAAVNGLEEAFNKTLCNLLKKIV